MGEIGLADRLRKLKHRGFLVRKRIRTAAYPWVQRAKDAAYRSAERVRPYSYRRNRYPGQFVSKTAGTPDDAERQVPRRIYTFWTGENDLTPNRQQGLDSLRRLNPDIEVVLVTSQDLATYVIPEHPLHDAYPYLSLVHRSDYLRCYFLHFYGGGYADIKTYFSSWAEPFERLASDSRAYALGYTEIASDMTAQLTGVLGRDLKRHYSILIGNGAYILRPQTAFTELWYAELLNRMDLYADRLAACPGDTRGDNDGYPIGWTELLANVFAPLALRYSDRLIHDDRIKPRFFDYK